MRRSGFVLALLLAGAAHAQLPPQDPDWREADTPPPPALRLEGSIPLEIPGSGLRFGVDPASISVGADGVVRYVVIATGPSGAVNANYEGIRCGNGDFKVYARRSRDSNWKATGQAGWRPLYEQPVSRHSLLIARSGACAGRSANGSAAQIVQDLRTPLEMRYQRQ